MKPPFDIAADLDTPVSAFLKLRDFQPRFLLESVEGGTRVGRYSFIGFGDVSTFEIRGDVLTEDGVSRPVPDDLDGLLDAFRSALSRAPQPGPAVPGLPFRGGLVGAAAYDLVRRFERLNHHHPTSTPGEGHPDASYMAPVSLLVFDHVTRRVALLHAGSEAERVALRGQVMAALRGPQLLPKQGGTFTPPAPSLTKQAFEDGVRRVVDYIYEGDVYQLVLASRFEGENSIDPFQVYRALRLTNPSPYMYYIDFGELQIAGSSPEALVKLDGRSATLRPIAGTRPRGATDETDRANEAELLADPKEAAEHVMLVDLARNDLGRVAVPGTVHVEPYRIIERYSHVMHIVSGVQGELRDDVDQFDLFAATFPAGTVVGAPKVRAMELIDQLEPVKRGIYAGTVGYFGHGDHMDQAIAIRTAIFEPGRYSYEAGAGVVADSVPEKEHAEILAKGAGVGNAMALAAEAAGRR
jgi:anthranilate synthase component I